MQPALIKSLKEGKAKEWFEKFDKLIAGKQFIGGSSVGC